MVTRRGLLKGLIGAAGATGKKTTKKVTEVATNPIKEAGKKVLATKKLAGRLEMLDDMPNMSKRKFLKHIGREVVGQVAKSDNLKKVGKKVKEGVTNLDPITAAKKTSGVKVGRVGRLTNAITKWVGG